MHPARLVQALETAPLQSRKRLPDRFGRYLGRLLCRDATRCSYRVPTGGAAISSA